MYMANTCGDQYVRQVYIPQIVCLPKKNLIYMSHKKRSPNDAQQ